MRKAGERNTDTRQERQRGSALLVALMVLVILSVLGVSFTSLVQTESGITANMLGAGAAFQAAEAGFHDAMSRGIVLAPVTPSPQVATLWGARPAYQTGYTFPAPLTPGEQVLVPMNNVTNCDEIGSNCKKGIPVTVTATGSAPPSQATIQGRVLHICALC